MPHITFSWDHAAPSNLKYRLYEDGVMVVDNIGELSFSLNMEGKEPNRYSYYVTAVDLTTGLESVPSNAVSVNFTKPAAPTGLSASFAG